ncbi:MAG: hypothetical protein V2B18_15575 [Pseudomonadota bacterium]
MNNQRILGMSKRRLMLMGIGIPSLAFALLIFACLSLRPPIDEQLSALFSKYDDVFRTTPAAPHVGKAVGKCGQRHKER